MQSILETKLVSSPIRSSGLSHSSCDSPIDYKATQTVPAETELIWTELNLLSLWVLVIYSFVTCPLSGSISYNKQKYYMLLIICCCYLYFIKVIFTIILKKYKIYYNKVYYFITTFNIKEKNHHDRNACFPQH